MAEVLIRFTNPIVARDGRVYRAQACGAQNATGMWEGWIEFLPVDGGAPVRSSRETTQPNRKDAVYWATGLTPVYLEGALQRALHPVVRAPAETHQPAFDAPAPPLTSSARVAPRSAILDPFSVYSKGETLLKKELQALSAWHLVNIITAYELSEQPARVLNELPRSVLVDTIVAAVRDRATMRP